MIGLKAVKDAVKQTVNQTGNGRTNFFTEHRMEIK